MPQTPHVERHFTAGEVVRDVVIGMSDGLTFPSRWRRDFPARSITAILSWSPAWPRCRRIDCHGTGGYLAAKSDAEHYASERQREAREVQEIPTRSARVQKVFADYGLSREESAPVVQALTRKPKEWVDFHDALRIGIGRARSQARGAKCLDYCRLLRRRGIILCLLTWRCTARAALVGRWWLR